MVKNLSVLSALKGSGTKSKSSGVVKSRNSSSSTPLPESRFHVESNVMNIAGYLRVSEDQALSSDMSRVELKSLSVA